MNRKINALRRQPWGLWWLQARRAARIEVRRNLLSPRAWWVYFLAFVPMAIFLIHLLVGTHPPSAIAMDTTVLAGVVQFYYIRLGIFFGCLGIFSRLIRGEMIERSIHFYLLAPVRREVLLLAKYAAGAMTAVVLFATAIVANFAFVYIAFGPEGRDYVFQGPGLGQLEAYLAVTVLGCLGYGAVFLLLSMIFRNPMPAAMLVWGWEAINSIMPSILQKISIASYLRHLMPISVPGDGIFALLTVQTEPVQTWIAVVGLFAVTVVILVYSCFRFRRLEIRYTTD